MDDAEKGTLDSRLAALRRAGAARLDPAGWHGVEVLAARLPGQPEPVRRLLQVKLQQAVASWDARLRAAAPAGAIAPARTATGPSGAGCGPLAALNEGLRARAAAGELPSVARFRRAWSSQRAVVQVEQAAARLPANAGPLNSHALVAQTLALMQELSPHYLARFVVHVESLQWLERAAALQPAAAKPPKAASKTVRRRAAADQPPAGVSEPRSRR